MLRYMLLFFIAALPIVILPRILSGVQGSSLPNYHEEKNMYQSYWKDKKIKEVDEDAKISAKGLEDSAIVGESRNYLRNLTSWLSPVVKSSNSLWKRCWRASVDGWAASTFHSRCDAKGPTVTIIRVGRYIFGGYTSVSWASGDYDAYQYDSKAFLFSLVNTPGWAPVKLPQTGKYGSHRKSILSYAYYGPTFGGGHDIFIHKYSPTESYYSYSNLGYTYSPPSGYSYGSIFAHKFLAGASMFTPDEEETFYETT